jgi:glutamate synthase (NADPH/NADH) small chain
MVVKALGQEPLLDLLKALPGLRVAVGKVAVDRTTGATSVATLFAGGDCIRGGGEIVDAVQDGKVAARGIHEMLTSDSRRFAEACGTSQASAKRREPNGA